MSTERQDKSPAVVATELTLKMLDKAKGLAILAGMGHGDPGTFDGAVDKVCEVYEKFYLKAKQLEETEEAEE